MKNILIINGHPDKESYNHALQNAYRSGAESAGFSVEEVTLAEISFSPILQYGYRKRTELEPDLLKAWEKMQKADHWVWIYPTWWGGMPAILKGFIERIFLPGFAFEYQEKSPFPKQLLKGKTSEIITTMDTPVWYYKLIYRNAGVSMLKKGVLEFCGVKNRRVTYLAVLKSSTTEKRNEWLSSVKRLGMANN
jgi:Putative NADPH-quinone reductase (modulator of drug activity B)